MWEFLKKIFSEQDGEVTVVVLDENDPDISSTFKLKSFDIVKIIVAVTLLSVLLTIGIFFATPLSSIYREQLNENFRDEVITINERVRALQDSLNAREVQLNDLKMFVRTVPDTTFEVEEWNETVFENNRNRFWEPRSPDVFELLTREEIITATRTERSFDFPTFYPVEGSLTQGFSPEAGHYGIDIAARNQSEFRVIADGAVIDTHWTINYGYVVYVQHADGIMSVYKHGEKLFKTQGDYVLKGDVLGQVGDRGVMSTGSHLHLEIWVNGVPKNPLIYIQ